MPDLNEIMKLDNEFLFQNYGRQPVAFERGNGCYLYDYSGKAYLDFFAGVAVSTLGYGDNALTRAMHEQIDRVIHTSNHYYNLQQAEAAQLLSELTFKGKTLFSNSGTEANEGALKLARRWGQAISPEKFKIISFVNSFHGRTFGSMSATGQKKIYDGFGPVVPGFIHLPYNDIGAFRNIVSTEGHSICGVMIELVQGEGGIRIADKNFINEVFKLCREYNILTILDEIQTGIGRSGKACAYQNFNLDPDIITLAKGLAGGMPIGAIHVKDELSKVFTKGAHGTTFGGNHLACAAASAILREIKNGKLLANVNKSAEALENGLNKLMTKHKFINHTRCLGLLAGIELDFPGIDIVKKSLNNGLIINCTADKVLRLAPPLTITVDEINKGIDILDKIFSEEA